MERKRKLPARAAARGDHAAKKRNATPRERSVTPAAPPAPPPAPEPEEPPPPPLPKSIQAGKPLPTVEVAQPEDLSSKDYQSVGESGVLAESLSRSRQKWISDGLFAKYWTKPHKRKGVINEDPKNPPKETMSKVGTVTITIEPHIIEATMYVVKDPKPKPQPIQQNRPIIQYGPPNGIMPPPQAPASGAGTPTQSTATIAKPPHHSPAPGPSQSPAQPPQPLPRVPHEQPTPKAVQPGTAPAGNNMTPSPSPNLQSRPQPAGVPVAPSPTPPPIARAPSNPPPPAAIPPGAALPAASAPTPATRPPVGPMAAPSMSPAPRPATSIHTTPTAGLAKPVTPAPPPAAPAAKPSANDPVIALLAQKASGDAELRDLMKRVAVGQAKEGELAHFQKIIDQLNAEYRSRGGQQGPSADRLLVDGRTVKYFAVEVRTILDIVLASNPNQKSSELRPPQGSDPLVVLLVKAALEEHRTRDMIRRIADGRPGFTDATDLKDILDRLHREMRAAPRPSPAPSQVRQHTPNGVPNGQPRAPTPQTVAQPNPQALRSKGPPPAPKPDVTAVVFDFGSGDRYLFPKFSILEYPPTPSGQQVVASFLIVRKGSTSEYGGDPKLDYYQPVTIRIFTQSGRHLENLARVVAPQDEVRRYMDDVMDNMTRAEYVLLAMRLPRADRDGEKDGTISDEPRTNGSTPEPDPAREPKAVSRPGVLWTSKGKSETPPGEGPSKPLRDAEQEAQAKYQRLINSVSAKDTDGQ
ncbi:hypothetical protein B0J15DRAFT_98221 [Fusarium solani]|uniref:SWR1-complex protein 3 domain-containing protein n=1 Tax=Fusarium solani TaxID=169388 RepID=A0A9P9RCD4_FUSSL|nr:uncharacterized protein B0J15DRAFT_98221 [Fusarium solani]KAH7273353.1 hypothetical protein B0J15DRAFT_98221 [Fusarium solani]